LFFHSAEPYAGMRYRTDRNQALDTLHAVATGPQRAGKLGKTAKVGLDHPSISVQERAGLQQRVDLKKQGVGKVSKASQTTTSGTHNDKYLGFKTTQQAINHILSNGTTFERFLARRLAPFLKDVQLQIVNSENELPELRTTDGTLKDSFQGANGVFGQWTRPTDGKTLKFIFLRGPAFGNTTDFQGTNNTVFLHEALHAATNARIDEYLQLSDAISLATDRKKEVLADIVKLSGEKDSLICGRNLTLVKKEGAVSYAKAIKELLPGANLEPYRGKPTEYWMLK